MTSALPASVLSPCRLHTPLEPDLLLLGGCIAREGLSTLGEAELTLRSEKKDIAPDALLGKPVGLTIDFGGEEQPRQLHGIATRFTHGGFEGRHFVYRMTLRPWLWLLTRTVDCRVFQSLSVPDIVKAVFQDHPVANFELRLFRSYRPWTYCVQYRESDFNFVARLLEHEGIYWWFEHEETAHKLVLCDAASAHDAAPGCESLPFYPNGAQVPPGLEYVREWSASRGVKPGKVVITDYDFERPSASLLTDQTRQRSYDLSDAEVFDYPGGYLQGADGAQYAEDRLDEIQSRFETFSAASNAQGLRAGRLLTLTRHPREDQNADYLVTATTLRLELPAHEAGGGEARLDCRFEAIPAAQQFRPPRRTVKPCVPGPQTAVVTGPAGEEIFTDKYGRVKVHFPWDRHGQRNETSSCWVSVSHPWAGANFGGVAIPRIGQEVIVGFLEGDPDRPIIIGRAYNGENMPPWELPANATQSGILTRSSKGAGYANANAIRFEDKKGAEQLWLHAEKNQDIEVEHDETHWVGNDRRKNIDHDEVTHVKHDRTETVDHNETITIGVDRKEKVGSNETISIGANRTEDVGADEKIHIGANRTESVVANETITIGGNRSITVSGSETATVALQRTHAVGINETIAVGAAQEIAVGAAQVVAVGAMQSITVGANQSTNVGANQSTDVAANQSTSVGANRSVNVTGAQSTSVGKGRDTSVGESDALKVGKNLVINAGDSVSITTGSASLTMKKDGTIVLKGKDITIEGSGKINVKADGNVVIKGAKILEN
ncbi:type VI secretion system Vgr family protein [Azohydromonas caseinilytica]|uniref:Type VI secretion system tip protein VgrG n=1 Tax=Azohydromonas caseinilytica TaxID=2728836 RepID=A0A848FB68_9BURK|nr:type VI secretion system tip protein TssI/VgrG [Azohydromonas caseinilytica]NML16538.1 type VI secretion system tip protein VgrG [Azohydromonas caseinilytica]